MIPEQTKTLKDPGKRYGKKYRKMVELARRLAVVMGRTNSYKENNVDCSYVSVDTDSYYVQH